MDAKVFARRSTVQRSDVQQYYLDVRQMTHGLCQPLAIEDYVIQPVASVSPPKWHLAHTTWFFETFVLQPYMPGYTRYHARYSYRAAVDDRIMQLIDTLDAPQWSEVYDRIMLGLHHEQQHQELLVTDIKYILATNPLYPVYHATPRVTPAAPVAAAHFIAFAGGMYDLGYAAEGFCFDNEQPAHRVFVHDFAKKIV